MMGHNGTIAFGLTLFLGPDEEDMYVYETSPDDPDLYRYNDGWERMTRLKETVKVKGASDQSLTLKFTRHGPIIHEDRANRRAYAVRSVWFEPGAAPYMVSISSMRAESYAQFARRCRRLGLSRRSIRFTRTQAATSPGPSPATAPSDRTGTGSYRFRATGDTSGLDFIGPANCLMPSTRRRDTLATAPTCRQERASRLDCAGRKYRL